MTARMANPSQRALKRHDLAPKADFVSHKTRTTKPEQYGVEVARARGKSTASAASASEIDPDKPLTEKQKMFVQAWAKGDSLPSAALRAGYADDGVAYRLARMPNILAYKQTLSAKYEEEAQMDRKQVMDGFKEAIEMARLMAEPANMIAGWREIGKMCGYYAPVETRVKVDVSGNLVLDKMNSLTDAELLKIISQGASYASPQLLTDETDGGEAD